MPSEQRTKELKRMTQKLIIITAPSGTGVEASLRNVRNPSPHHVVKVEKALAELATPHLAALLDLEPGSTPSLMEALTLPRPVLTDLWPQALQKALADEDVAHRIEHETIFLSFHAAWLHIESGRLISEVHHPSLQKLKPQPSMVITLIDDLYDNLVRLSRTGQLMEWAHVEEEDQNPITAIASQLMRLLSWREAEVRFAQQIANSLSVPHFLFAVKHPLETFERLVTLPDPHLVYNAHPISVPRRDLEPDDATAMIRDIGLLAAELRSAANAVLFEPTSIDELRFSKRGLSEEAELTPRWPVPHDQHGSAIPLLWDGLADDSERAQADQPFRLLPPKPPSPEQIQGAESALTLLKQEIATQISWRDRQLVEQSKQIIQVRPFANPAGKVSSGVAAEIRLHRQLYLHERNKGALSREEAIIYHPSADEKRRRVGAIVAICQTRSKLGQIVNWSGDVAIALKDALLSEDLGSWEAMTNEDAGLRLAQIFADLPVTPRPEIFAQAGGAMEPTRRAQQLPRIRRELGEEAREAIAGISLDEEYELRPFQTGDARRLVTVPGEEHPAAIGRSLVDELGLTQHENDRAATQTDRESEP